MLVCAHTCVWILPWLESHHSSHRILVSSHINQTECYFTTPTNSRSMTHHMRQGKEKVFSDDIFFVYCRVLPYKPSKRQDVFLLWLQLKAQPLVKEGEVVYHYNATQCAEIAGVSVHVNVYIFENWRLLSYCLSFVYYFLFFFIVSPFRYLHMGVHVNVCDHWICVYFSFTLLCSGMWWIAFSRGRSWVIVYFTCLVSLAGLFPFLWFAGVPPHLLSGV